jgi:hypothetical protein
MRPDGARIWVTVAATIALTASALSQDPPPLPETIEVSGRVTDWWTCPLPGATVRVMSVGKEVASVRTDEEGGYRLSLPAEMGGQLRAVASAPGFAEAESPMFLFRGRNLWDVGLPIGIEHDTPVRVTGIVRDQSGAPIRAASVTVQDAFTSGRMRQVRTDGKGRFTIEVYQPGQYVVHATAPGHVGSATIVETRPKKIKPIELILRSDGSC